MARTKGPNTQTSRANFDAYAKHSGGTGFNRFENIHVDLKEAIAGVGCCASLNKSCHVFIMAPDSDKLQEALDELRITKDERSAKDVSLIAIYPARIPEMIEIREDMTKKIYWVIDSQKHARMLYGFSLRHFPEYRLLEEVERGTELELKLLLRGKKWERKDIDKVTIDLSHPDDDIPF